MDPQCGLSSYSTAGPLQAAGALTQATHALLPSMAPRQGGRALGPTGAQKRNGFKVPHICWDGNTTSFLSFRPPTQLRIHWPPLSPQQPCLPFSIPHQDQFLPILQVWLREVPPSSVSFFSYLPLSDIILSAHWFSISLSC